MSEKLIPLFTAEQIKSKVQEIGSALNKKFKDSEPVALCILSGSFMFYADLIRAMDFDITCEFLGVSSYKDKKVSSGEVAITLDLEVPLQGKDIILVEDLVDTGLTMNYLIETLKARGPRSITTVALMIKPKSLIKNCTIDFSGFEIGDGFVVGYGIDFGGQYRNLPYIATLQNQEDS
jgi:hypoxanthine phosphoribosyltransferase